ncbi:SgcJ/EcaC family oxidoreductase [Mucilaginibacter sp. KACC 22773]|uniref:YybH family protein n=1 Tax=Mucilaginibacter sp. KACC 22773 TaxID=3025671 RepID=UPI002366EEF7|nr:SgcJ/EcaC family oxidoreductase [Mucilaginibacter sp. KACC 22773]WDF80842.1 SgcJ/EcaC family oxidoreductase [Mucilaginibacter sp. KACC 22773]
MKVSSFKFIVVGLCWLYGFKAYSQQTDTTKENPQIRQLIKNYEDAWNRHDPKGLADNYTVDATWVNWFGAYYKGRDDIQFHYQQVHTTYFKGTHYYTRAVEDIIYPYPNFAISHVRTALDGDERFPGQTFEFRRMIVMVKRDGSWKILAGQNAKLEKGIK